MFLQMLKDEFPDVRLHIISKLEQVNKGNTFGPDYMNSLTLCSYWYPASLTISPARYCPIGRR